MASTQSLQAGTSKLSIQRVVEQSPTDGPCPLLTAGDDNRPYLGRNDSVAWKRFASLSARIFALTGTNQCSRIISGGTITSSQFPIPDSRFPVPSSQFPIPDSRFPIPQQMEDHRHRPPLGPFARRGWPARRQAECMSQSALAQCSPNARPMSSPCMGGVAAGACPLRSAVRSAQAPSAS